MPEQKKYTIKPLDWQKGHMCACRADTPFGTYGIYPTRAAYALEVPKSTHAAQHPSIDAAKLAAESHYRSRLLPALEEVADGR